eukprot:g21977.t1
MLPALLVSAVGTFADAGDEKRVVFNRDIRPLLSDTCYKCHGPDAKERQAGLRFDVRKAATSKLESGETAIVAGSREKSALWQRITAKNPDERMPPHGSGKQLSPKQIELIGRWIDQGAQYQKHWSFIAPIRPAVFQVRNKAWPRNPIDSFILARLEQEKLAPSPEADKTTLIRRVTFDLTGLPPTLKEIEDFLADKSPNAYETVVDRLLKSPQYGEHRARYWLDAARYGDTHGLHLDNMRSIWPYRDWVIRAFNKNMPFDQFTIEQIAGDLLPNPTLDQKIATGFNRCNVTTSEGGSISEEYRVRYAVDRVEAIGTVFLGLTVGCAVCHDHKFDPVTQREFYSLFDYYANTADRAMDGNALLPPPAVKVPSQEHLRQQKQYNDQIAALQKQIRETIAATKYVEPKTPGSFDPPKAREVVWVDDALPPGAKPQGNEGAASWQWIEQKAGPVFSGKKSHRRAYAGQTQHFFTGAKPGLKIGKGDRLFAYVYLDPKNPPKSIMLQFNDGRWEHRAYWGANRISFGRNNTPAKRHMGKLPPTGKWTRLEVDTQHVGLKPGAVLNGWAFTQFDGTVYWDKAGIVTTPAAPSHFASQRQWEAVQKAIKKSSLPKPVLAALKVAEAKRNAAQQKALREYFLEHACTQTKAKITPLHQQIAGIKAKLAAMEKNIPSTLVMQEKETDRLPTYVLTRGEYDQPDKSQRVTAAVPKSLGDLPKGMKNNRLALAKWLVNPQHPLTARVTLNRVWQQYFGTGLVKTAEDFGAQGEWPSHPELLDWLARDFIDNGWNVKRLHKMIVMSATYRQSSKLVDSPKRKAVDPENRLLSRGPRFRLDAEMIRDNALAVSGLLVRKIGGPSVKPYQPKGLWKAVGYTNSNTANFKQDHGDKLYRRSMYTFWKRTSPPPSMATFDAPSREACTVRRERTNTPMQALLLMNDVQFVEASRKFAERIMHEGGKSESDRIVFGFRSVTARRPSAQELSVISNVYRSNQTMNPAYENSLLQTRRHFFSKTSTGIGTAALASVLSPEIFQQAGGYYNGQVLGAEETKGVLNGTHFAPKAKRVIYLFMSGAPSQLDMYDYKPQLQQHFKKELPASVRMGQRLTTMTSKQKSFPVAPSIFKFKQYGPAGAWISELLPHTSAIAGELAIIKTVHTEAINHDPAITYIQTGFQKPGRPSLGAWLSYGLGRGNKNLPAFVVLTSTWSGRKSAQALYERLWGTGFLPSRHAGVALRAQGDPVLYLSNPPGVTGKTRRTMLDALSKLNKKQYEAIGDPEINARIAQYEMAFRMQTSVPELTDISKESKHTLDMYGPEVTKPGTFAASCLLARRLAERNVKFVQIFIRGWDQHGNLPNDIRSQEH